MWTRDAAAKVNLTLDILGRRPDGFHDMRMVMQTISLCDTVTVEETGGGFSLRARGLALPAGEKSLEQRAAEAFFRRIGRAMPGLAVALEKVTPAYAGLGGGSADVAALLRILRDAYAPNLPGTELEAIGAQVGSDMPFCIRGGTCLAEGRGEILTDLPPLPECRIVLCKPDFDIPTPSLFARVDSATLHHRPDSDAMIAALYRRDLRALAAEMGNVFEQVLPPEILRAVEDIRRALLDAGALNAIMSGSGPAVFGLFDDFAAAGAAVSALSGRWQQVFYAKPVERV